VVTIYGTCNTVCPTRYRTRHLFNNFTTNEDIATKFEADYRHIPLHFSHNERTPVRWNIFICVRIIKEMPGSVASGTSCIMSHVVCFAHLHQSFPQYLCNGQHGSFVKITDALLSCFIAQSLPERFSDVITCAEILL